MKSFFALICFLFVSTVATATTYTLAAGNGANQISAITFNHGDTLKVPANTLVNFKSPVTISKNIIFNIYGTFAISQSGSVLTMGNGSIMNLFPSGGTISSSVSGSKVVIGATTVFDGVKTVTATNGAIVYKVGSQGFAGPLPLKFASFEAAVKSATVALSWTAVNDGPANMFTIQQSTDGKNWNNIATVKATGGDHETVSYSYEVAAPNSGTAIYRAQYTSTNGEEVVYSNSRLVNFGGVSNQTTAVIGAGGGRIQIGLSATEGRGTTNVIVTTMDGKIVYNGQYSAENTSITIPVTATGILAVTVTDGSTYKIAQKVSVL